MVERVGMVTLWCPAESLPKLNDVTPLRVTRQAVNAAIAAKAKQVGAETRFDPRAGKDSRRLDAGRNYGAQLRGKTIAGAVIVEAIEKGRFYAVLKETTEAGGRKERKLEIRQIRSETDVFADDADGVLTKELFGQVLEAIGERDLSVRGFWLNPGPEGPWANIVIGPVGPGMDGPRADLRLSHDGQQVVVEVPENLALPAPKW